MLNDWTNWWTHQLLRMEGWKWLACGLMAQLLLASVCAAQPVTNHSVRTDQLPEASASSRPLLQDQRTTDRRSRIHRCTKCGKRRQDACPCCVPESTYDPSVEDPHFQHPQGLDGVHTFLGRVA